MISGILNIVILKFIKFEVWTENALFISNLEHHTNNKKTDRSNHHRESSKWSSDSLMSESEHQNLRNGIQSLMSQMDNIIAEIKNK